MLKTFLGVFYRNTVLVVSNILFILGLMPNTAHMLLLPFTQAFSVSSNERCHQLMRRGPAMSRILLLTMTVAAQRLHHLFPFTVVTRFKSGPPTLRSCLPLFGQVVRLYTTARDGGQLPISINLHDWIDLSRIQDDIRACFEQLRQEVQFLANESKTSEWIAEENLIDSGRMVNARVLTYPPYEFDESKIDAAPSILSISDPFLEHIATLTLADHCLTPPDTLSVIESLRKRIGAPIDLGLFQQLCEHSATEGFIDTIEWILRNRLVLTERAWQERGGHPTTSEDSLGMCW